MREFRHLMRAAIGVALAPAALVADTLTLPSTAYAGRHPFGMTRALLRQAGREAFGATLAEPEGCEPSKDPR